MKRLTTLLVLAALLCLTSSVALAGSVNFANGVGGNINLTPSSVGTQISFSNLQVTSLSPTNPFDSAVGTPVSIVGNNSGSFLLGAFADSTGTFSVGTGSITIGNSTSGILSGNVSFVKITSDPNNPGSFTIALNLSNLSFTNCSASGCVNSAFLESLGLNSTGKITFQFEIGGPQNLADLYTLNSATTTSLSGTIAAPEPATLALFGSGLLFGARKLRRKLGQA